MRLRLATIDDAEAIRQIYNLEVTTSTATFDLVPRTLEVQREWLDARSGAHAVVVAVDDAGAGDGVLGFGSLSPWRDRPAYSTTVEDSVYIHRDHHGQGVGKAILQELVTTATNHGFHACMARIVGGHDASIALHVSCGFEVVGTEREVGRKFGKWLDVVLMERLLVSG
jgi:phosphinothricin acetyltransferase